MPAAAGILIASVKSMWISRFFSHLVLLYSLVVSIGSPAFADEPQFYWNKRGHCVQRTTNDAQSVREIIQSPEMCNHGNPVYVFDNNKCYQLESNKEDAPSESIKPDESAYRLTPTFGSFYCNETKPLYWKIGQMTCAKTTYDQSGRKEKTDWVGIENCARGITPFNGGCYVDTHYNSKQEFVRATALDDDTPCRYSTYVRFGQSCFYFRALGPSVHKVQMWDLRKTIDYEVHRVESFYCKDSTESKSTAQPQGKQGLSKNQKLRRESRETNHDGHNQ